MYLAKGNLPLKEYNPYEVHIPWSYSTHLVVMKSPYAIKIIISYQIIAFPITYYVICCTIIRTDLRVIMNDVNIITFLVYLPLEEYAIFEC